MARLPRFISSSGTRSGRERFSAASTSSCCFVVGVWFESCIAMMRPRAMAVALSPARAAASTKSSSRRSDPATPASRRSSMLKASAGSIEIGASPRSRPTSAA